MPSILLAEDDPATRMLLARLLKKAGYEVEAVADGAAAYRRIQQKFFPILVTDWEMPEMDGIALCRNVRELHLDGYVYSLLLTARDSKEHLIAGLEAGADDYLTKPVYEPELIARLKTGARIVALEQSLRAVNQRNRILSITDALTGAYNRRYLMEQLPRELERSRRYGRPLSVAIGDIDFFKRINDGHGHSAGDEVLSQFAKLTQASIRATSDWVARYGGEEFVIVLPETSHGGAIQAAEKMRAAIAAEHFMTSAGSLTVTASFGVASTPPSGPDSRLSMDQLIATADACLYASKQGGRNKVTGREAIGTQARVANA
jgi:two-component system, cell cycle response regulator